MPKESPATRDAGARGRWWPEALLVMLATAAFLGCLGSLELWEEGEQRVSLQAIDTSKHQHWLAAESPNGARLDEPPLERWAIAAILSLTGCQDEWAIRLPGALSALGTVALVYFLGRRIGGRPVGLASALVICSLPFFVVQARHAGGDAPLAFFTSLALYAVVRALDPNGGTIKVDTQPTAAHANIVLFAALGLGFLTKGSLILLVVGATVIPYLAVSCGVIAGLRRLVDVRGLLVFAVLGLSWPAAVLVRTPSALGIHGFAINNSAELSNIFRPDHPIAMLGEWLALALPWSMIALIAMFAPGLVAFGRRRFPKTLNPAESGAWPTTLWLPWWWVVGSSLAVSCLWSPARPSDYLPCLPGLALLVGSTWIHLARSARGLDGAGAAARAILQAQWVLVFVGAIVTPIAVRALLPATAWPWSAVAGLALATAVVSSRVAWRRGADAIALAPISAACIAGILIVYGFIAPVQDAFRGHRALAESLARFTSSGGRKITVFRDLDDGLRFYLRGVELIQIAGADSRHIPGDDRARSVAVDQGPVDVTAVGGAARRLRDRKALFDWLDRADSRLSILLLRSSVYDDLATELGGRVAPLFRETRKGRDELVALEVMPRPSAPSIATGRETLNR